MNQSFTKLWIHAVWSTKERQLLIPPAHENNIHDLIRQQLIENECPVRIIGGMADHIHALFLLNPKMALADLIKQIKGATSHEINRQNWLDTKFSWQNGYAAFSVSDSQLDRVFQYINHQKQHHEKKDFQSELNEILKSIQSHE